MTTGGVHTSAPWEVWTGAECWQLHLRLVITSSLPWRAFTSQPWSPWSLRMDRGHVGLPVSTQRWSLPMLLDFYHCRGDRNMNFLQIISQDCHSRLTLLWTWVSHLLSPLPLTTQISPISFQTMCNYGWQHWNSSPQHAYLKMPSAGCIAFSQGNFHSPQLISSWNYFSEVDSLSKQSPTQVTHWNQLFFF